jgi:hypothetical protein
MNFCPVGSSIRPYIGAPLLAGGAIYDQDRANVFVVPFFGERRGVNLAVDNVHTLGCGSGLRWGESRRIPHVSAGAQCFQGPECSSRPTSGTHDPSSEGFLL